MIYNFCLYNIYAVVAGKKSVMSIKRMGNTKTANNPKIVVGEKIEFKFTFFRENFYRCFRN